VKRALASLIALVIAGAVHAQSWPSKPVRMVIPYPAGGSIDVSGRRLAEDLGAELGQPIVVENRAGANGIIATDFVAKSPPDGYTLLVSTLAAHAGNPFAVKSLPYDPVKDFAPVTEVAWTPNVLVVNPKLPVHDVKEFIAYAKAHPGELNFGSGSTGSAGHLAGELFKTMAGVKMVHVPYKGAGPAMQDLIGGQIQLMFDNLASSLGQIHAGKVRALAVTTAKRSSLAPELPTIAESGLPGFDISTWFGIFAPGGAPRPVVERLHDEFVKALDAPDVQAAMKKMGAEPVGNTPEQFAAYIQSEAKKYAQVIKASGAKVD
jgi:tripartite-type tricarboxylate transporter receptor subunit TctC